MTPAVEAVALAVVRCPECHQSPPCRAVGGDQYEKMTEGLSELLEYPWAKANQTRN